MEARIDLPLTLLYSAFLASAQTEVPAEITESLRAGGPYAEEAWRELRPVIWSPGAWLLENSWVLAVLLSLLVWTVAGRVAWAAIKKFIIIPSKRWASEGAGKRVIDAVNGTCDRLVAWCDAEFKGPVGERMLMLGVGMLAFPFGLFIASSGFAEGSTQPSCIEALLSYGFGAVAAIVSLCVLAWVLLEVGRDAHKSITSMRQPGVSVEYPYSIRAILLGLGAGIVGLAVWYMGFAITEFGNAQLKDMEVLAGVAVAAVGVLITLFCLGPLLFSVVTLAGPIVHALAVFVMWPFVIVFRRDASGVLPSDERESPE
jgi:hypothetical protein